MLVVAKSGTAMRSMRRLGCRRDVLTTLRRMQPESDIAEAPEDISVETDTGTTPEIEVVADEAESSTEAPAAAPETAGGLSVDELESHLGDLQGAMDQLQSGDLDAAERAIESLEQRIGVRDTES